MTISSHDHIECEKSGADNAVLRGLHGAFENVARRDYEVSQTCH